MLLFLLQLLDTSLHFLSASLSGWGVSFIFLTVSYSLCTFHWLCMRALPVVFLSSYCIYPFPCICISAACLFCAQISVCMLLFLCRRTHVYATTSPCVCVCLSMSLIARVHPSLGGCPSLSLFLCLSPSLCVHQ
jgi:hypothetical protein